MQTIYSKLRFAGVVPVLVIGLVLGGFAPAASAAELPRVYVHDIAVKEGENANIPIRLNEDLPAEESVTITLIRQNQTSTAATTDYTLGTNPVVIEADGNGANDAGIINFAAGADTLGEGTEVVRFRVSSNDADESGDVEMLVRILDHDAPIAVSIDDEWKLEGDSGSSILNFTVRLSKPPVAGDSVTMRLYTGTGTTESNDYDRIASANSVPVTFTAGETVEQVPVTINGDTSVESVERFPVYLTKIDGAVASDKTANGYIRNDDGATTTPSPAPRVYIGDTFVMEGDTPDKSFTVPIRVIPTSASPVTFRLYTGDGSAKAADDDYDPVSRANAELVTIPANDGAINFNLTNVDGDVQHELPEDFRVYGRTINNASFGDKGAVVRVGEEEGPISLNVWDAEVEEGEGAELQHRIEAYPTPVPQDKVNFRAQTGTLAAATQNATSNVDFTPASLTRTDFSAASVVFDVPVLVDGDGTEDPERVKVDLVNISGAIPSDKLAFGWITEPEAPSPMSVTAAADIEREVDTNVTGMSAAFAESGADTPYTCTVSYGDATAPVDGTVETVGADSCNAPPHSYDATGDYTVTFTVTDSALDSDSDTMTVYVREDGDNDSYFANAALGEADCNDGNADVNPGETEVLNNGIDDDCDAATLDDPPPTVVGGFPQHTGSNVAIHVDLTVVFSESMDAAAFNPTDVTLEAVAGPTPVAFTASITGDTLTVNPDASLTAGTAYRLTVNGGAGTTTVQDLTGNDLQNDHVVEFTTAP